MNHIVIIILTIITTLVAIIIRITIEILTAKTKQFEILQLTTRKLNNCTWKTDTFEKILMKVALNMMVHIFNDILRIVVFPKINFIYY